MLNLHLPSPLFLNFGNDAEGDCAVRLNHALFSFSKMGQAKMTSVPTRAAGPVLRTATRQTGARYSPAKRPNCQKPNRVATSVTVVAAGGGCRARRGVPDLSGATISIALGSSPAAPDSIFSNVRCDTPIVVQSSGMLERLIGILLRSPGEIAS